MGKLIIFIAITLVAISAIFLGYRYNANIVSEVPYPYYFGKTAYKEIEVDAPILIIGDRLGQRLASFSELISQKASVNLSKKIKIQSLALNGEGLHRTLQKIKSIKKLPLITIYLGGSEEFFEQRFMTKDTERILKNFDLYSDEAIQTLLMIFPSLSPLLYQVVDYKKFKNSLEKDTTHYSDMTVQKRNIIHFKIYERELDNLVNFLKEHNSYLIAITQPLNIDIAPKKDCYGAIDELSKKSLDDVIELVKLKDFKSAYNLSKELVLIANASARAMFVHGKISQKLGKIKEAIHYLKLAMAYDCQQWRGNPVYNRILKKIARQNDVPILDFQAMLERQWMKNYIFADEIYPQNLYYEKVADILAMQIKKLLKL